MGFISLHRGQKVYAELLNRGLIYYRKIPKMSSSVYKPLQK